MAFPNSKIIPAKKLVQQIIESNKNGERFCFILGSGASVESNIPSGSALEMRWMNCIMGVSNDMEAPPMDADFMRRYASNLYYERLIQHSFEEIESAWKNAKKDNKAIPSEYYFDIYKLRFSPNPRNGYRYLERLMEDCEPSLGYHTLALMLSENDKNNLVITTNFDSLVEDALFLYTDKKPLVVSHESLAGYIESDIRRPIIAKVHRGLMYAPFNSPETTQELKKEWREALDYAFSTYTPIVVGYGGGDHSLMTYLEESTSMRHGIYWCYQEVSGLPDENIQKFIEKKDGCFVAISGFDALMMEIGTSLYKEDITPSHTEDLLQKQCKQRIEHYNEQWEKLNKNMGLGSILQPANDAEKHEEEKREKNDTLTAWDYIRRGNRAVDESQYEEALKAYAQALEKDKDNAMIYFNRGFVYVELEQYDKAIADYSKAIELDPYDASAYNNRGIAYKNLGQYDEAITDYSKAIKFDPNYAVAYNNRGFVYDELEQYSKAIADYSKAIELNPNYVLAYNNRGVTYKNLQQYKKAIEDWSKAIELDPNNAPAYNNRGAVYDDLGQYEEAFGDYSKAIELDPNYTHAYNNRGIAYQNLEQLDKAIEDYSKAIELDPNFAHAYDNRGSAYYNLKQYEKAIEDCSKAIELDPKFKNAYLNRAEAYRALGKAALADADEAAAKKI